MEYGKKNQKQIFVMPEQIYNGTNKLRHFHSCKIFRHPIWSLPANSRKERRYLSLKPSTLQWRPPVQRWWVNEKNSKVNNVDLVINKSSIQDFNG